MEEGTWGWCSGLLACNYKISPIFRPSLAYHEVRKVMQQFALMLLHALPVQPCFMRNLVGSSFNNYLADSSVAAAIKNFICLLHQVYSMCTFIILGHP